MKRFLILLLLAGFSLTRCSKGAGEIDTSLLLRAVIVSGDKERQDTTYTESWDAFWFYADTLAYNPPSRQDVLARRLTAQGSASSEIAPDGTAEVVVDTLVRFGHLKASAVLVIYQPESQAYAWRQLPLLGALPQLQQTLYFRLWQATDSVEKKYSESKWTVVLQKVPAPDPETE